MLAGRKRLSSDAPASPESSAALSGTHNQGDEDRVSCRGSGGLSWNRENTREGITLPRLREAVETGAETLFTACHY